MKIDTSRLVDYKVPYWYEDHIIATEDSRYTIIAYNITECRMGSYSAQLGIISNDTNELILNTAMPYINYTLDNPIVYLQSLACIAFSIYAFKIGSKKSSRPSVILDMEKRMFCIINVFVSFYYEIKEHCLETREIIFTIRDSCERETKNLQVEKSIIVNLDSQKWYDLEQFEFAFELFHKQ